MLNLTLIVAFSLVANTYSYTSVANGPSVHETGDLVAIGDVHGSLDNLLITLYKNGIVDENGHWVAGNRTVVQTGDLIGRGHQDKQVIEYIIKIQKEAEKFGGRWVQLMGNHEWMEIHNIYDYANDGPGIGFGSLQLRHKELHSGEIGDWLYNLPVIYKWEDTIFVHGGLSKTWISKYNVDDINQHVWDYLDGLHSDNTLANDLLWDRDLATKQEEEVCSILEESLYNFNSTRMVLGHTITNTIGFEAGKIGDRCDGKLILIDVGLSSYFKSIPKKWSALHIYRRNFEHEAMIEAMSERRIDKFGRDRTKPEPRDNNGTGRKDILYP